MHSMLKLMLISLLVCVLLYGYILNVFTRMCLFACDCVLISIRRCETVYMVASIKHWAIFFAEECYGLRQLQHSEREKRTNLNYLCIHLIESWINVVSSKLKIIKFIHQPQNKNNDFIPLTHSSDQIAHENNAQCQWNFTRVFTECTSIYAWKTFIFERLTLSLSLFRSLATSLYFSRLLLFKSSYVSRCLAS